jgi:Protein of unknown function (DUF2530)
VADVTESQNPLERAIEPAAFDARTEHHHLLEQAPVPAVDADGIVVVTIGTVVFAIAAVVLGIFYSSLARADQGWWLWVGVGGFALGLFGIWYCVNRQRRRRAGRWDRD